MATAERWSLALSRLFPWTPPGFVEKTFAPRLRRAMLYVSPSTFARLVTAAVLYPLMAECALFLVLPLDSLLWILPILVLLQAGPLLLLSLRTASRKRGVEAELPFLAMLLYILSHDSFPTLRDAFSKVQELGRGIFPAFTSEAESLARNLTYSSTPDFTVFESFFADHPSGQLRDFIHGYVAALASGRDAHAFVSEEAERLLGLLVDRWRAFAGMVSSATEVAFIFLAIFPIGIQFIAGAFTNGGTSVLLLGSIAILVVATVFMLVWLDHAQPSLNDRSYPIPRVALVAAVLSTLVLLYAEGIATSVEAAVCGLGVSLVFVHSSRNFFARIRRGETEVELMLHDLAESTRAGHSLSSALSQLLETKSDYPSLGDSMVAFVRSLSMGEPPRAAQRRVSHPSGVVRLSFGLLAASMETGSGYEQMDRLSLAFRKVSDARRSIQTSVLPFAVLGASVPVISVVSFWLLGSIQGLSLVLPGLSFQSDSLSVGTSILATSLLTGFTVSKAYSLSFRSLVGIPPILLSALVSFLVFGFA